MERSRISTLPRRPPHQRSASRLQQLRSPLEPLAFLDFAFSPVAYNGFCRESRAMKIQQHAGFYIAGLTARTHNAHEMSGKGKIGNIWQQFLQPHLVSKIPNKMGVDLIAAYTDYESTTPATTPIFSDSRSFQPNRYRQASPSNTFLPAATPYSPPAEDRKRKSSRSCGSASGPCPPKNWVARAHSEPTTRSTINAPPTPRTRRSTSTSDFADRIARASSNSV